MSEQVAPRDLRHKWLSEENAYLMSAVWRFAKDYFNGIYRVNDLFAMNCQHLKNHENVVVSTTCDRCKYRFGDQRRFLGGALYCLVNNNIVQENENNLHNRFKLICKNCFDKVSDMAVVEIYQLYPTLSLSAVEGLVRCRFVTRYLFPVENVYTISVRNVRDETLDVARSFQDIVSQKASNEQIVKITLRTYAQRLFSEELNEVFYAAADGGGADDGGNLFKTEPKNSTMLEFVKNHKFINLTYFYEIEKRIYHSVGHDSGYVAYFAKPYFGVKSRFACVRCKSQFYKKNPIIYCSKCGFVNRVLFSLQRNNINTNKMVFFQQCVQAVKNKSYCILYYDMNIYARRITTNK
uniref:Me53 n=1 Tax=Lymantria dispar multicapsid nuclear polyhedrosis virus TaxID=10449 RepID=A0A1B1MQV0_NPVLD|nr:me53 [Lymantria dispar multiple nucleopolyhedrovirus]